MFDEIIDEAIIDPKRIPDVAAMGDMELLDYFQSEAVDHAILGLASSGNERAERALARSDKVVIALRDEIYRRMMKEQKGTGDE